MTWSGPQIDFLTDEQLPKDMLVNNELTGIYTVAHGVHKNKLDQYESLMFACAQSSMENAKFYYQDVEYALYYFMRIFIILYQFHKLFINLNILFCFITLLPLL